MLDNVSPVHLCHLTSKPHATGLQPAHRIKSRPRPHAIHSVQLERILRELDQHSSETPILLDLHGESAECVNNFRKPRRVAGPLPPAEPEYANRRYKHAFATSQESAINAPNPKDSPRAATPVMQVIRFKGRPPRAVPVPQSRRHPFARARRRSKRAER